MSARIPLERKALHAHAGTDEPMYLISAALTEPDKQPVLLGCPHIGCVKVVKLSPRKPTKARPVDDEFQSFFGQLPDPYHIKESLNDGSL